MAAGPVSRILSAVSGRTAIPLGHALLRGSSDLPGGGGAPSRHASGRSRTPSLFGLAPCGVCPARHIAAAAVRSYRTFSPLPEPCGPGGMFSVALSVESTHPGKERKDGPPSRTLSGTLLCGVRTFLCLATATVRSGCQQLHYSAGRSCRWTACSSYSTSLGARRNVYVNRAKPINNGISPAR